MVPKMTVSGCTGHNMLRLPCCKALCLHSAQFVTQRIASQLVQNPVHSKINPGSTVNLRPYKYFTPSLVTLALLALLHTLARFATS